MSQAHPSSENQQIRVWDLPLRLFHWLLLAAVATAILSGEVGGGWMELHGKAGLAVVGLLAFRIVWGLVGSPTARFWQFFPTPGKVLAYLRGQWHGLGHNPLGAFSVFGLIGVLALQAGTGLFGNDDIAFTGPLNSLVEEELGLKITGWHRQLVWLVFLLLALHLSAIVFYRVVKKHNLVKPMLTGWAPVEAGQEEAAGQLRAQQESSGSSLFGLVLALAVAAGAVWVASGGPWKKPAPATSAAPVAPAMEAPAVTSPAATPAAAETSTNSSAAASSPAAPAQKAPSW